MIPDNEPRARDSFDFGWKFLKSDAPGAELPGFLDTGWSDIDLPHDWSIEGPFVEEPGSSTYAHLPGGIGWYRKRFQLPEAYQNKKVVIEFDGVYQNSEVWVNGQYLGRRPYGYISFSYDLTPYLSFGRENLIAVKVDNSQRPNCRWYSGSGIYRHTWLRITDRLHVAQWGTYVTTPEVDKNTAHLRIRTRVQNENGQPAHCRLITAIFDDHTGEELLNAKAVQDIPPGGEHEFTQRLHLPKPHLWSADDPHLYRVRSTLIRYDRVIDQYDTVFGIRKIAFDASRGFLLNNQPVKLNGVCLHHDGGCVGAAVPERVWERRLELLKAMGCNAIRTSHNPYAPEFMDLCDRMGFLVMDELFDEWKVAKGSTPDYGYRLSFDEWSEQDAVSFIQRDRNHPCVVLWSAGNEVPDQITPGGADTLKRLVEIFHREDPTRLVTVGCDQIAAEPAAVPQEFLDRLDVVGYNYVDRWRQRAVQYYSTDRQAHPHARVIGTESTGMYSIRGDYSELVPNGAEQQPHHWRSNRWIHVEELWKFMRTHDYVAGDFMWTGIDYLGEAWWPAKSASFGVLDTCGFPKDGYYFYQSQWTEQPMLHLFPHWNWPGKEGDFIPVLCYTNCDTVELFLNGKSLGVQGYWFPRYGMQETYGVFPPRNLAPRTTSDLHLAWTVPYQPGMLKAVGMKDGQVVATEEICTTGEPAAVGLAADRETIAPNSRDVVHITVSIQDAQGRVAPTAGSEVSFEVQGPGKLIGVDNGDPASHEDFKSSRRRAFNGLCLAIVQATGEPGLIQVMAASPGLAPGRITISVK